MKKLFFLLSLLVYTSSSLVSHANNVALRQQPTQTEAEKMAKVRAAKAQKKEDRAAGRQDSSVDNALKAKPADYKASVDKVLKGPSGEAIHTGERGGKFYINKNGNKTYLSSNQ